MSGVYRRFELLLPLRFNDGTTVPDQLIADILTELEAKFGAVSCETQNTRGQWRHQGQTYRDDLVRLYVDVPDAPDQRPFFADFKERAKATFGQIDLWMTTYLIEVI
jgi:hypothetical protein